MNQFRRNRAGVILIEFAFSVPVFLALIYYVHDLPKMKRWHRKMQFATNEVTMILQNIGAKRAVTIKDIEIAMRLAFLSLFPEQTMYSTDSNSTYFPRGYFPHVWIHYVVGTGENKATIKWGCAVWPKKSGETFSSVVYTNRQFPESTVKFTSGDSSDIHPKLRISNGEVKIIVECGLWYGSNRFFSGSNISCSKVSARKAFGFLFINPPASLKNTIYFTQITIFTPHKNAFSGTAPSKN